MWERTVTGRRSGGKPFEGGPKDDTSGNGVPGVPLLLHGNEEMQLR